MDKVRRSLYALRYTVHVKYVQKLFALSIFENQRQNTKLKIFFVQNSNKNTGNFSTSYIEIDKISMAFFCLL